MANYTPTLDDVETLVNQFPENFSNPLNTRRNIATARADRPMVFNKDAVMQSTAASEYDGYIENGGTPIGPNGEMPSAAPASDQPHGAACAECEAAGKCCIKQVKFKCAHGSDRMTLPLQDETKDPVLVIVTDKDSGPPTDTVTIEIDHEPNEKCCMDGKVPVMELHCTPPVSAKGTKLETKMQHGEVETMFGTDLEVFLKATGKTIWGNVDDLGMDNNFSIQSCGGCAQWAAKVRTYPKLSWKAADFVFGMEAEYDSSFNFSSKFVFEGSLGGDYSDSSFEVKAGYETGPTQQSRSAVPFLDAAVQRLKGVAGNGGPPTPRSIRSKIKTKHKMTMGKAEFKLAERADDHSAIGVDADITMGFSPLIGLSAEFEVIDILLTAAIAQGAPARLIDAIKKARDWMAREIDEDSFADMQMNAEVRLIIGAETGIVGAFVDEALPETSDGEAKLTRAATDTRWTVDAAVEGKVGVTLKIKLLVEGRVWLFKGTLSASAEGKSEIKGKLSGLSEEQRTANPGGKLSVHIEWTGAVVELEGEISAGFRGASIGASGKKTIEVFPGMDFYKGVV